MNIMSTEIDERYIIGCGPINMNTRFNGGIPAERWYSFRIYLLHYFAEIQCDPVNVLLENEEPQKLRTFRAQIDSAHKYVTDYVKMNRQPFEK